jgi:hypothetical protein
MSATGGKDAMEPGFAASEIDTSRPHPARMYDAYLGGKDNYAADREAVRQVLRIFPEVRAMARANRAFMRRAVRFLAGEAGIRQFIDIGTGIPSAGNVHEVAGQVAPGARVVYVDNDPIVHVHANALLTGSGATTIVLADLRTWRCRMGPRISTRRARPVRPPPGTAKPSLRWCCAPMPGSPRSSTVLSWWSLVWCRHRCGGLTASRRARRTWPRSGSTQASAARAPDTSYPAACMTFPVLALG